MDALEQSSSPGQQFYLPEMMRSGCTEEKNTGLVYDPRFTPSGLFTDLYSVQTENSVTSILEAEPSFSDYVTTDQKKSDKVSSWNRATLNYNLQCDADGPTRTEALATVVKTLEKSDSIPKIIPWSACFLFPYLCCMVAFAVDKLHLDHRTLIFYGLVRLIYAI